ncbi:MAG: pseudouridine synthase [Verrucomicrobiales bacterium]|nr:pseudouridine synthase [Verrucomicrobiales bacterium]
MQQLLNIIFEDAELLVVNKPADLVCHPTKGDVYSSLISRVRLYLGPDVSCHMVNRLDRETSGVTFLAKSSAVAGELGKLWEARAVEKEYLAIVHGHVGDESGTIELPLGKDEKSIISVKDCVRPDGTTAKTQFYVLKRFAREIRGFAGPQPFTFLRVVPRTGRKHQIRIHLQAIGHPIVGDKLYGGDEDLYLALAQHRLNDEQRTRLILPNQALHAAAIRLTWHGEPREFTAEPEEFFTSFANDSAPAIPA